MPHAVRRLPCRLLYGLGAAIVLGAALILLLRPGAPSWDAGLPLGEDDLMVGRYRAGAVAGSVRVQTVSKDERGGVQVWMLSGAALRFAGDPPRLIGAEIDGGDWAGPRGLRVGDPLDKLYTAIPMAELEDAPDEYVLLYAAGLTAEGLPKEPYAVIVPSGGSLCAHLVSRLGDGSGFAICDVYADPDTSLIERIVWEIAPADGLWQRIL